MDKLMAMTFDETIEWYIENKMKPRIEEKRREYPHELFVDWLEGKIKTEKWFQKTCNENEGYLSKIFMLVFIGTLCELEMENETPEQVDEYLRKQGYDPEALAERIRQVVKRAMDESPLNPKNQTLPSPFWEQKDIDDE